MNIQTNLIRTALQLALACCFALTTCAAHAQTAPQASVSPLLFHASFDNTLEAQGPSGAIEPSKVSGKIEYRDGKFGHALLCGGDGASLEYPTLGSVRPSRGTIDMWVQPVDWTAKDTAMHVFFETPGPGWLVLYKFWSGGLLMLSGSDHSQFLSAFDQSAALPNGQWHHLAGVWHADEVSLYIDGALKETRPLPPIPTSFAGSFKLGDNAWDTPHADHTLIEDVNIYRYALPPEQIALAAQCKPLTYAPPLQVRFVTYPASHQLKVEADANGYPGIGNGSKVEFSVESGKRVAAHQIADGEVDGVGNATLDLNAIPAGTYRLRAAVIDGFGRESANSWVPFVKPPPAPWTNNKLGMRDIVLAPYTPIQVTAAAGHGGMPGTMVNCWGRKYNLNGLFPSQIESAGHALLAAPIRLSATTAGGEIDFKAESASIDRWGPTRAHQRATGSAGQFAIATDTTIEYDGMLWTDVTIAPRADGSLSDLTLHIPLRADDAIYQHQSAPNPSLGDAGSVPEQGYRSATFLPSMWLGNNDRGLAWFAETQQGWSNAAGKTVQEIVRNGATTELQIHFVNRPTSVTEPLRISFGMEATPVKPLTIDRSRRLGVVAIFPHDDPLNVAMGNLQVIWPTYALAYFGYPLPADPPKFRQMVANFHQRHALVIPYINLNYFSQGAPEWNYYSADWRDPAGFYPGGGPGANLYPIYATYPHSASWRDFIAYKIAKFVDEYQVDGLYVDCWFPYPCYEPQGGGWRDASGKMQPLYPIRDYREISRRVREILAERRPNIHILEHMSADIVIPTLSFADSMLDGEQYQGPKAPNDDYLKVIPLDRWRAEHDGLPWGIKPYFLPEFVNGPLRTTTVPTQRLMGLLLAHDITVWPIWCNERVVFDNWKAMDKFGANTAQFLPYWKPNGISTDNHDVLVSAYRQGKRAMLVVLNTALTDTTVQVTIDPVQLGIAPGFKAHDLLGTTPVTAGATGFTVDVAKRNYRLIEVE